MNKFLGIIIISLALVAVACGGGSEFPTTATVSSDDGFLARVVWPEIEKRGKVCTVDGGALLNADGSDYRLTPGAEVEVLEDSGCDIPPAGLVRIRVIGEDIEGWTFVSSINYK